MRGTTQVRRIGSLLASGSLLAALLTCGCASGLDEIQRVPSRRIDPATVHRALSHAPDSESVDPLVIPLTQSGSFSAHVVRLVGSELRHLHRVHDVSILVHSGEAEVFVDDVRKIARTGAFMHIPRETLHYTRNRGSEPLVLILIFTPPYDGSDTLLRPQGARSYER